MPQRFSTEYRIPNTDYCIFLLNRLFKVSGSNAPCTHRRLTDGPVLLADPDFLKVGQEPPPRLVVGMADVVSYHGLLSADITCPRHGFLPKKLL